MDAEACEECVYVFEPHLAEVRLGLSATPRARFPERGQGFLRDCDAIRNVRVKVLQGGPVWVYFELNQMHVLPWSTKVMEGQTLSFLPADTPLYVAALAWVVEVLTLRKDRHRRKTVAEVRWTKIKYPEERVREIKFGKPFAVNYSSGCRLMYSDGCTGIQDLTAENSHFDYDISATP